MYDNRTCTDCGEPITRDQLYQWTMVRGLPLGAHHVLCPHIRAELEAIVAAQANVSSQLHADKDNGRD